MKEQWDPEEVKRLWRIVDQANADWRAIVGTSSTTEIIARKKVEDAFDAYHRYLDQHS